jgi:hypothetical protein
MPSPPTNTEMREERRERREERGERREERGERREIAKAVHLR